jgi:hypothetical protein
VEGAQAVPLIGSRVACNKKPKHLEGKESAGHSMNITRSLSE